MKASDDASAYKKFSNENTMAKVTDRNISKGRQHSPFEWVQLIATICIPIIIAIYSIIDNNNKESIAVADRRKDMEIASNSRMAELEIAKANRLHEMIIAEENQQKDRELALDQQRENILAQYQTFMANLLMENGLALNKTSTAKVVALSMTLTTLSQLDPRRKGILIRSLYHSKLITLHRNSRPFDTSILTLYFVDLSHITFGSPRDSPADVPIDLYVDWYYIWLPHSTLTNASFRHAALSCATFSYAYMEFVDLSFAKAVDYTCFGGTVFEGQITFAGSKLVNASFYKAHFRYATFSGANLTFANMRNFYCMECPFYSTTLYQADLSFSLIFPTFAFHPEKLPFNLTNLRQAVMHSAILRSTSFFQSDWSYAQASQISLPNCTFINARMDYCSLTQSFIHQSLFQNASLFGIDLSYAKLDDVSFIDVDMRNVNMSYLQCNYCDFINVNLQGAVLKNASLRYSTFRNCQIDKSQLEQAIDLSGSTLPNGTVVKSNE